MNVGKAYEKYMTPKNLQEHMLRVASLSKIIVDNWIGPTIDKLAIIKACAMHDIAKPVAFNTSKAAQAKFGVTPEDALNMKKLQNFIKDKFGSDEHKAAIEMCKDMNLGEKAIKLLEDIEWKYTARLLSENNLESLIPVYCDMRIGPRGLLSLTERINNLGQRTIGHDIASFHREGNKLEQKLQENISVDLNLITEQELESLFPELLSLEI
jgi:hypothetical protein